MDCLFLTVGIVGVEDDLFVFHLFLPFFLHSIVVDLPFFSISFLAAGLSREGLLRLDRSVKYKPTDSNFSRANCDLY